jgi:hypothetical protein
MSRTYSTNGGVVVKPERKRPLGRSRQSQVDNTNIDLRVMVLGGWIVLTGLFWLRIGTSEGLLWTR